MGILSLEVSAAQFPFTSLDCPRHNSGRKHLSQDSGLMYRVRQHLLELNKDKALGHSRIKLSCSRKSDTSAKFSNKIRIE